jgi:PAS domain S-box-containing protein
MNREVLEAPREAQVSGPIMDSDDAIARLDFLEGLTEVLSRHNLSNADRSREILARIRAFIGADVAVLRSRRGNRFAVDTMIPPERQDGDSRVSDQRSCDDRICGCVTRWKTPDEVSPFTRHGSFWTNRWSAFVADAEKRSGKACYVGCGQCLAGCESIAILPIRTNNRCTHVLQLGYAHEGLFSPERLEFLDRIALLLGASGFTASERRRGDPNRALPQRKSPDDLRSGDDIELRHVAAKTPLVLVVWCPQGDWPIVWVTDNVRRFGYEPEELISGCGSLKKLVFEDDLPQFQDKLDDITAAGQASFSARFRLTTKLDNLRWVEAESCKMKWPGDDRDHVVTSLYDVTMSMGVAAAHERELHLRRAIEASVRLGIVVVGLDGRHWHVNKVFAEMVGWSEIELLAMSEPFAYWSPGEVDGLREYSRSLLRGENQGVAREFTFVFGGGHKFPVMVLGSALKDDRGGTIGLTMTVSDLTQRKAEEAALRHSEREYRELVQNANSVIMRRRVDGTITFMNAYGERFFGYSLDEIVGQSEVGTIVPKHDTEGRDMHEVIDAIGRDPDRYAIHENENMCKNGDRAWVSWTNRAILDQNGNVVEILCVGNDITALKNAEKQLVKQQEQLRALAAEVAGAEEKERERLASVLHDDVGQQLAASALKLNMLSGTMSNSDDHWQVDDARKLVLDALSKTRSLVYEIECPVLKKLGLPASLEKMCEEFQREHGVSVRTVVDSTFAGRIDRELETFLYRSARELICNALRHAEADEIEVHLQTPNSTICLTVLDNGRGFDTLRAGEMLTAAGGFGLYNIGERLTFLGGSLDVQSKIGKGSRISMDLPWKGAQKDRNE